MKTYIVEKKYRESQFSSDWKTGKPVRIEARNIKAAERKAEKMGSVYTHYTVISEA